MMAFYISIESNLRNGIFYSFFSCACLLLPECFKKEADKVLFDFPPYGGRIQVLFI